MMNAPCDIVEVHRALGRLEGKIDGLVDASDSYGARVEKLQRDINVARGGVAAVGILSAVLAFWQHLLGLTIK